ncbi:hypothetical protein CERZMDRAFT_115339 [Cercospora zeae-maydis SCOH1-5]|uniref:PH domain-containing protein n=1 Tax=Cercospora zeae-maydis SCOH1-5 TaxID=717836 RepID=A0A6A6F135_9PEZI|nr:hypothetical protein CERZMDRAFT_115339 [Cercospora zeae-maydis SCOH1-5]
MFRKKKEYLVLTEYALLRYKTQAKAAEHFRTIPNGSGRSPMQKHASMPSAGSHSDLHSMSESSGDKDGRVPLRQIVATHKLDDGKPYFALEVAYLDEESGSASVMTLQFAHPEERDGWLVRIRSVASELRSRESTSISPRSLEHAARIVEREHDYDPANCAIYKVVQRQPSAKSGSKSSTDDLTKILSTVCFLAIGVHKVHLISLAKPATRTASPLVPPSHSQASYGILTLIGVKVSSDDDTFELVFRQPMQKPRVLCLAAASSFEIAARLHWSENFLRPECGYRLFRFKVPVEVDDLLLPPAAADVEEHNCLERTLIAYCVAYGLNPSNIRYTINYNCEDAPRFELLAPADLRRATYGPLELLAIMRAVRYNETFGSISFAGVNLDSLNGLHDNYGNEHVCTRTKRGTPIKLSADELSRSSLLVQEVRAIAATSKKLRRMDFSGCVTVKHADLTPIGEEAAQHRDIGSGVVEALFPLCKHQTTNVDWICLNGIELSETDHDYLVGAAVDKSCHFRAIELNRCGLNDRSLGLILDALRGQENTLESLEIAGNSARLSPSAFDSQLGMFAFIRKLNLSHASRTSGNEAFIQAETLLMWRLQELRLTGTSLNPNTIDAISTYLAHPQSASLHELYLDNTYLTGSDVATLLHSMSWEGTETRDMHLDISQCVMSKGLEKVTQAISNNHTPSHLSMRSIEYKEESQFRKVLKALTVNKSIRCLDISQTGLPGDASDETCDAIARLLAKNATISELDISGDDSRLATSKFGPGINEALKGLKDNTSLQIFKVEKQKLGIQGANTLAEVLRMNRTLLELHCDNNEIPLHGLTDLVNALTDNTVLVFLPAMNDGRAAAFKAAEATMRTISSPLPPETRTVSPLSLNLPPSKKAGQGPSGSSHSHMAPFTIQDVQTTHRLLTEQWDRQCYRLEQYLHRNWCLLNNVPVKMEIEDEKFERPGSVKIDTTPKADLDGRAGYFYSPQDSRGTEPIDFPTPRPTPHASRSGAPQISPIDESKHGMSFRHFMMDRGGAAGSSPPNHPSGRPSAESQMRSMSTDVRSLRIDTAVGNNDGLGKPT